jgi:hypothetical protein
MANGQQIIATALAEYQENPTSVRFELFKEKVESQNDALKEQQLKKDTTATLFKGTALALIVGSVATLNPAMAVAAVASVVVYRGSKKAADTISATLTESQDLLDKEMFRLSQNEMGESFNPDDKHHMEMGGTLLTDDEAVEQETAVRESFGLRP